METATQVRHPGPEPVAPVLPVAELEQLARHLEDLVDELARCRRLHEDSFPHITNDKFTGETADAFRWALASQLRRSRSLETTLLADLDEVRWLLVRALELQTLHDQAHQAWLGRVATYQADVLALGRGPLHVPEPTPWAWATPRSWP